MQDEAGGGGTGAVCDLFPRHFSPGLACLLRFLIVRPAGAFFAQLFLAFLFNKLFFFLHFFILFFLSNFFFFTQWWWWFAWPGPLMGCCFLFSFVVFNFSSCLTSFFFGGGSLGFFFLLFVLMQP